MVKVEFVINRLGRDPSHDQDVLENVSVIKEIPLEGLPDKGDFFDVDGKWGFPMYPVVRFRTSHVLEERSDGVLWTITMRSENKELFKELRKKGWK